MTHRLSKVLRWYWRRRRAGRPRPPSDYAWGYLGLPRVAPDLKYLRANAHESTATWLGHSTTLIQLGGTNLLIDPVFSDRSSPLGFLGPKRKVPPPARLRDLPPIDMVLLSHGHYDHLDRGTIKALNNQKTGPPLFLVPMGMERWMRRRGVNSSVPFDWWQERALGGLKAVFVPSRHWSGRAFWDRESTLWGGWVIEGGNTRIYYVGDTGYSALFKDVGERFEGFDLAVVPIGGYEPRWFMREVHVDPEEAVRIHLDVRARRSIGVHWGTFELSDEPLDQPIVDLRYARDELGVSEEQFILLAHGETLRVKDGQRLSRSSGAKHSHEIRRANQTKQHQTARQDG